MKSFAGARALISLLGRYMLLSKEAGAGWLCMYPALPESIMSDAPLKSASETKSTAQTHSIMGRFSTSSTAKQQKLDAKWPGGHT